MHELSAQLERKTDKLFKAICPPTGCKKGEDGDDAAEAHYLKVLEECGDPERPWDVPPEMKYRSKHGTTVLMKMARFHDWRYEISSLLGRLSVDDVNAQDNSGATALHFAAKNNHPDTVNELLNQNADPSIKTHGARGKTAADFARMEGHNALAKMLDEKAERWIKQQKIMDEGDDEDEDGDVYYSGPPRGTYRYL